MMSDTRPWYHYDGQLFRAAFTAGGELILGCPRCGDGVPFTGEPRDEMVASHRKVIAQDGALTLSPSVVCPRGCGWHVFITAGAAKDC